MFSALSPEIHSEVEAIFLTRPLAEWCELSAAAGLTFAPVATLPEYIASEQARAAGAVATLSHPTFPEGLRIPNTPFGMPGADVEPRGHAPEPGEHTHEILSEAVSARSPVSESVAVLRGGAAQHAQRSY